MNIQLFKDQDGKAVIQVNKKTTFRKALVQSGLVTEGKNRDWGHTIVYPGLYSVSAVGRTVTLEIAIPKH